MMRPLARRTKAWRSRTRVAGVLRARRNTRHSIRATSATAFIGTTAAAAAVFYPHGAFEHLRLPASCCQTSIAARAPGYAGTTSWPLPAAVSAPWAKSRRHVKSWFGATPWRRATKRTNHARLERLLDDLDFLRRCPARRRLTEIAPELTGHGLTLSKCEAYNRVYGQFYRSRGATFAPAEDQNGKSLFRREGIEHSRP